MVEDLAEVEPAERPGPRCDGSERHQARAPRRVGGVGRHGGGLSLRHLERAHAHDRPRRRLRRQQRVDDAARHREARREARGVQDRRRDVERRHASCVARGARPERSDRPQLARLDGGDDPVRPVPRGRGSGELGRILGDARVLRVEAVGRGHQDPGLRPQRGGEPREKRVRVAVGLVDHRRAPLRVAHEAVRERVQAVEVDHQQVGLLRLHERLGQPLVAPHAGQRHRQVRERVLVERGRRGGQRLADLHQLCVRDRGVAGEVLAGELLRPHQQLGELGGARRRRPGARVGRRAGLGEPRRGAVRDDRSANALGRPGGEPADDGHGPLALGEEVPERGHAALGRGHRRLPAAGQVRHEVQHAVVLGPAAGGDRGPEDRRHERRSGAHHAGASARPEAGEARELAARDEAVDREPVAAVDPDERDGARLRRRRGRRARPAPPAARPRRPASARARRVPAATVVARSTWPPVTSIVRRARGRCHR